MAYGRIITQEQAEEAYGLLGDWQEANDPGREDETAEFLYDFLRWVLQYDEATPQEFLENQGFTVESKQ